jgi:hypothetical protein
VHPYCITIDEQAMDYLPHMFGANSFAVIDKVERLPLESDRNLPEDHRLSVVGSGLIGL